MPAQFYCWDPTLGLDPDDADFEDAISALHELPPPRPGPRVQTFVRTLASRFAAPDDAASAAAPLDVTILGGFVDLAVSRSLYLKTRPILIKTARVYGLNCYDLQDGQLYPARLH